MAVTKATLRLLAGMRIAINNPVDAATQTLITAWGTAWTEVAAEWDAAINDLVATSTDGAWPSRTKINRAQRARNALKVTRDALNQLVKDLPVTVLQDVPNLTTAAADWQARLTASQLPPVAGTQAELAASFNRVDPRALDAVVKRTTGRVTALSRPLSAQAEQAMKSVLIRGVTIGDNPRTSASIMLDRVQGAFEGGRNRALVIARTEILDAHRAATTAANKANADTLTGWQWVAQLDKRTCPSCWSLHGSTYDVDDAGPHDHQQGRCVGVPVTKTWAQLGFGGLDEPASVLPDARAVFDDLPRADRVAVMGPQRLQLLDRGEIRWADLSRKRTTAGWRDSYAPTPLGALVA